MKRLEQHEQTEDYRYALMQFLNDFGLEAPAILNIGRRCKAMICHPHEAILRQGVQNRHVYFLIEGHIHISINNKNRITELGDRGPVTVLGEISFFNSTPPTATVRAIGEKPTILLQISFDDLADVLGTYPTIRNTLARIGELRLIRQYNGFISYTLFMDYIGWKRDRLGVTRALHNRLEELVDEELIPRLGNSWKMLDCGQGPGIISEILYERDESNLERLFLQASQLEDAILNPMQAYPSDLSRTRYLTQKFNCITALQVFEYMPMEQVDRFFRRAHRLMDKGGLLLVIQLKVVPMADEKAQKPGAKYLFHELEELVLRAWPDLTDKGPLVSVTFIDADFDPMMEWNPALAEKAAGEDIDKLDSLTG
ncbi:MAG: cyclic nucleotide-binding domain-containing protein, partial [Deltaproteobacteria bacterium]|nr:cyclic nucleotide-binding domain-containing protein [Deltaproteobacteria bacterium]